MLTAVAHLASFRTARFTMNNERTEKAASALAEEATTIDQIVVIIRYI